MSSLHLDSEEEPRRGAASRANSVRFDERALQGAFGHGSRSSTDLLPMRTGSAFGSHPLTERSSSHKSDGRQSSAGQSIHSARASSFGIESRPLSATVPPFVPIGPPPGLFILGPVPSIIRCWLSNRFSNDSLLYAVVCTGSYRSILDSSLLSRLGYEDQITTNLEGQKTIKLPVYLPEATIQQPSSRSDSPTNPLPTLTVDFVVQDLPGQPEALQIYIGCDVLRARNGDIHMSLDRLTILDDDRNKLSVPLVRPENASLYHNLQTMSTSAHSKLSPDTKAAAEDLGRPPAPDESNSNQEVLETGKGTSESENSRDSPTTPALSSPSVIGEGRKSLSDPSNAEQTPRASLSKVTTRDSDSLRNGSTPEVSSRSEGNGVWGSWRREAGAGSRVGDALGGSNASGYQRAGRGRGMKVLKPARLNTSRSSSVQQMASTSDFGLRSSSPQEKAENQSPAAFDRRVVSGDARPQLSTTNSSKPRSSNPIGGASAFGWLNSTSGPTKSSGGVSED